MNALRSSRSGFTGVEVWIAILAIGAIGYLFMPSYAARLKDRKVAKIEKKIENTQSQITTQDNAQLAAAHQLVAGTGEALARIPEEKKTPESNLATELNKKADSALSVGRNQDLTPEQRQAMTDIVTQALSPLVAENAKARASLADLTGKLNASVSSEEKLRATNATLTGERDSAVNDALAAAAQNEKFIFWLKLGVGSYAFIVWGLPLLGKFYPGLAPIVRGTQWIVSQAGAASMSALTATVRGVEEGRKRMKAVQLHDAPTPEAAAYAAKKLDEAHEALKTGLAEEIYDADDARVQQVRREEALV